MDHKYWIDFWKEYTTNILHKDQHSQVLRTFNKKPISERLWDFTLSKIDEVFTVKKDETVLDLCSGNGLLAKHFLNKGASVVAVDVSEELLVNISNIKGIKIKVTDQRLIEKTGGIIQGMSGSPIIQDHKIVGAISHVIVDNPLVGYGVYVEWMLTETL